MIYRENNVLSTEQIDKIFDLYRNSTNWIELDGLWQERHVPSTIGHFLITEFTSSEIDFAWHSIKPALDRQTGTDVSLVYARLLKYNRSCHIPPHLDAYDSIFQRDNDLSVIIQLNSAQDYVGGAMIVSKTLIELEPGDSVFYTYNHEHQVSKIKRGVRYVLNLRCKKG